MLSSSGLVRWPLAEMMKGVRKIGEKIELMQKPFPVNAMIRQVEGINVRWVKKMMENKITEKWDGEYLSEAHR